MSNWALSSWSPRSELPLSKYLVPTLSEEGKQRMKLLGNIVVPPQAAMAAALLTQLNSLWSQSWSSDCSVELIAIAKISKDFAFGL